MHQDWSAVPSGVVEEISKKLESWVDNIRFRSVCTSWRSAAPKRPRLPLLLTSLTGSPSLKLCNFPNTDLYATPKPPEYLRKRGHKIIGCSRGWLCSIYRKSPICLHNIFTGAQIRLPVFPNRDVPCNVVLSADPAVDPHRCVVFANFYNRLLYRYRPGDASWTLAFDEFEKFRDSICDIVHDIIFYKNKAYIVSHCYKVFVCEVEHARFTEILPADRLFPGGMLVDLGTYTQKFLVVSSGDLLLAEIIFSNSEKPSRCHVFQIDLNGGQLRLVKLESLGGHALFLSPFSMSVSVDTTSTNKRCQGNCIYYAGADPAVTVFNMRNGSISSITDRARTFNIWVTPSIC